MQINVTFRPRRQEDRSVALDDGAVVADLVRAVGESVDVMVALRGGRPIAEDEVLADGEAIVLLSAASGG